MDKKILIVDDEPNILLSLDFIIQKAGYQAQTAADGEEALEQIKQWQPDLVLLDVNMPKLDGFEVCQIVRENPALSAVKIIMLTAKGRQVEREKGLALGADDYVSKPFSTQEIIKKINDFLDE
ncbi:MAG TPA: two-component system response regulator [Gammaproteobacteria bacterium]|jgi:DNA-binding response OmpR family regulator|nr:two-component system response regulator [Gammaproteobacteria bacterium]